MKKSFIARYGLPILIGVVFMLPVILLGGIKALLSNKNDVKEWLPASFQETGDYEAFRKRFKNETFVLASWEGCTLNDQRLGLFAAKIHPPSDRPAAANGRQLIEKVITGRSVIEEMTAEVDEKSGKRGLGLSRDVAVERLTGSLLGPDQRERHPDGTLVNPQQPDDRETCVVITVTEAGKDEPRSLMAAIYEAAAQSNISRADLRLGGPPVDNAALDTEGERMIVTLAILCGLIGLALSYYYLRNARLTAMVFVVAVYSAAMALAMVYFGGATMDSILLTMPAVVYTSGLSGAIHLINYYRHTAAEQGIEGAPGRGVALAWLPCMLSASTTAIGLISLLASDLIPIEKFGLYSGLGVLATLALLYTLLPTTLHFWPPKMAVDPKGSHREPTPRELRHRRQLGWIARKIVAGHAWIWAGFLVVAVACGAGLMHMRTSVNLLNFFSRDAEIRQHYTWLEEHIGPLVPLEVVVELDQQNCNLNILDRMQLISRLQQQIEELPNVGRTLSTVTFGPPVEVPTAGRGIGALGRAFGMSDRMRQRTYSKQIEKHRESYLAGDYLAEGDGKEFWRINVRVAALKDIDYGLFMSDIEAQVDPVLAEQRENGATGIDGVTYTGLTPLVYKAQRSLLNSLIDSFFWAFVTIAAMMALVFRSAVAGFLTMIPNVWPVVVVFGALSWVGVSIDIGTMMTASVAMGVCVDDTVHFANWFRRGLRKGLERKQAVVYAFENCAGPMYQSSAIIAVGLLTFGLSNFVPTVRFGLLMFTLLTFGLFADLVLTPAMLAGPLGYFFSIRRKHGHTVIDDLPADSEEIDDPELHVAADSKPGSQDEPEHVVHAPHRGAPTQPSRSIKS